MAITKGSFDPFELGELEEAPAHWDNDFSKFGEFSDLEYTQIEFTLGGTYALMPTTALQASVSWMDLTDDQPYVYGDLSGSLLFTRLGMRMRF